MEKMTHSLWQTATVVPVAAQLNSKSPLANVSTAWTREQYLEEFKKLTAKMLEITIKKNNDYGGTSDPFKNFRSFGALGILVRASDKMARLKTAIVEKRKFEVDESLEDTCLDLSNYALLLLCYLRGSGDGVQE